VNAADNLHAFPSIAAQVSSARWAVVFSPVVEALSVSLPAPDAETPFAAELDWQAAPRASAAQVSARAAGEALTAEDALALLAAELCAPSA
jgi:hypothetical protein